MNSIIIKGRLTRDPELKYVSIKGDNKAVCKFSVAVDRTFGEGADFFNCQAWGKTGEIVDKFFTKGKEILISGSMECNPYENKEGKKQYPWQLNVNRIEFCGSKNDSGGGAAPNLPDGIDEEEDPDIPF